MTRRLLLLLMCAALAAPAAAQPSVRRIRTVVSTRVETRHTYAYQQDREEQTERVTKTFRIGPDGELFASNIAGDIVVTRTTGTETTVAIVKSARARTADDARQMLALVQVDVREREGRAEVKAQYPNQSDVRRSSFRNVNVSVAYTISAPAGTRLTLSSISGNVSVSDIKGDVAIGTISGNVRIANGGRIAGAKSISGNVEINDAQIDGSLEAGSVSGAVIVRKVRARRLDVGTISGNVVMEDLQCDRVAGHSVSGDVSYSGTLMRNGRYELNSHSGQIRMALPGDSGFELEANSFSGTIRSDLPVTLRGMGPGRERQRTLRGVYGDGSTVLDLTTFSGSVVITKR